MKIDIDELTLAEIADLEDACGGISMEDIFAEGAPRGRPLMALVWVFERRHNPDFTLEDAGNMTVSQVQIENVPLDPTEAKD